MSNQSLINLFPGLVILLISACGSEANITKDAAPSAFDSVKAEGLSICAGLNESTCKEKTAQCLPIYGRAKGQNNFAYLSCEVNPGGCDDAIGCAWPQNDLTRCYLFNNGCSPSGWTTPTSCDKNPNCAGLN